MKIICYENKCNRLICLIGERIAKLQSLMVEGLSEYNLVSAAKVASKSGNEVDGSRQMAIPAHMTSQGASLRCPNFNSVVSLATNPSGSVASLAPPLPVSFNSSSANVNGNLTLVFNASSKNKTFSKVVAHVSSMDAKARFVVAILMRLPPLVSHPQLL